MSELSVDMRVKMKCATMRHSGVLGMTATFRSPGPGSRDCPWRDVAQGPPWPSQRAMPTSITALRTSPRRARSRARKSRTACRRRRPATRPAPSISLGEQLLHARGGRPAARAATAAAPIAASNPAAGRGRLRCRGTASRRGRAGAAVRAARLAVPARSGPARSVPFRPPRPAAAMLAGLPSS